MRLMESMEQKSPKKIEELAPKRERAKFPPGCVRSRQRDSKEVEIFKAG